MPEDPRDLRLARRGDRAAQARVIEAHQGLIVGWCQQARGRDAGNPPADLDDLLQEARVAALRAIRTFDPRRGVKLSSYLMYVVTRHLGHFLALRRERPLPSADMETRPLPALALAFEAVDHAWLEQAMAQLSPLDRQVLELKFGLSGGGPKGNRAVGFVVGKTALEADSIALRAVWKLRDAAGPDGRGA